jgi:hypothetical protein
MFIQGRKFERIFEKIIRRVLDIGKVVCEGRTSSTLLMCLLLSSHALGVPNQFRVYPYLQNPTQTSIEIIWFSEKNQKGKLEIQVDGKHRYIQSEPYLASTLSYFETELEKYSNDIVNTEPPYLHRVIVTDLKPNSKYTYIVSQNEQIFESHFSTSKTEEEGIRFIVYSDSETEPESVKKRANWPGTEKEPLRKYLVDQSTGYRENINIMSSRKPDFILISGDLVESGNEQRDWDEFWRHNAGEFNDIASRIPIFPAIGNHENYPGPDGGSSEYIEPYVTAAISRYKTYFYMPENNSSNKEHEKRYYRIDYGPVTIITLDSSDGDLHKTKYDTNWRLDSNSAPDFNPGSEQYKWLEQQLRDSRDTSQFTFVQFHHSPYSVGPHGLPPGSQIGEGVQSGVPLRVLTPLFVKYGVSAVFAGHDEMYERSFVDGIHFYDVGIGGDGLRAPFASSSTEDNVTHSNPYQSFLAHTDAPEVWSNNKLQSGGKHYGHIEVNIYKDKQNRWTANLVPVISFPVMQENAISWERRTYNDTVVLQSNR